MGTQTNSCVVNFYHQTKKSAIYNKTSEATFFSPAKKIPSNKACKMILSSLSLLPSPRCKITQDDRCTVQHTKHSQWEFLGTKQIMLGIQICWKLLSNYPLATTQAIGFCQFLKWVKGILHWMYCVGLQTTCYRFWHLQFKFSAKIVWQMKTALYKL